MIVHDQPDSIDSPEASCPTHPQVTRVTVSQRAAYMVEAMDEGQLTLHAQADEADAVQAADFIGKKRVIKRSWGFSAGRRNVNYSETEEHRIKPHKLRNLHDHECVLVHCERGFRRVTLPPLEPDGTLSRWFSRGWL